MKFFNYIFTAKIKKLCFLITAFALVNIAFAQFDLPFGFEKKYNIPVYDSLNRQLPDPWTGGMYAVQFGEIDLDDDGIRDLVGFDRYGNRTLTWKNHGIEGEISYEFLPDLAKKLPRFDDWVIFADYNYDGLNDIFTYSKGFAGIIVYRNNGAEAEEQFELVVSPYLTSYQGSGYVNILVTYVDYPAIVDIDKDGDLDILTFWGLGSFVEMHTNESTELYGTPDSLVFRKTANCWGRFAESEESNMIYLDTCFAYEKTGSRESALSGRCPDPMKDDFRHTGSTFLILDENGDGLDDLLLGDVDYAVPALLTNAGTSEEAVMGAYTFNWPAYDTPVDLWSFPVMALIDVNNNGAKDLIASVFDPSLIKSENKDNIWLYDNVSQGSAPDFRLQTRSFLKDDMLGFGSGTVPLFFDYDLDGLQDILVGNFGYLDSCYYGMGFNLNCLYRGQLALLRNTGQAGAPAFKLVDSNFAGLPAYFPKGERPFAIVPAGADLDGDGDTDLLLGNAWGNLLFLQNVAEPGQTADFVLAGENYQNIVAGTYSAPQLFDLTSDGLVDLVIGKRNGTISFYENSGNAENPVFTFVTDSLGSVDVRDPNLSVYGNCIPHFFRDSTGKTHLFAGSEFGHIYYYSGIDGNLDGKFKLVMTNYQWINEGLQTAVAVTNLNNDQYPDMIVGNFSGGLSFFAGTTPPPAGFGNEKLPSVNLIIYPNPVNDFLYLELQENPDVQLLRYQLFDYTGKEWLSCRCKENGKQELNVSGLPAGIFLLNLHFYKSSNGEFNQCYRIIKL
ncbi:MAG TPA: FG-GAP-like repeat-containing protein [Bacteroidales bacterium]|nr:FG-GAP-like repeat-containing protein [Bacteroidales bacterium]